MKNPLLLLTLCIVLVSSLRAQQADKRAFLEPKGYTSLQAQYDGTHHLQLIDGEGNVYTTKNINEGWALSGHTPEKTGPYACSSRSGVLYLSKDTQVIKEITHQRDSFIWRTVDSGRHWQRVIFDPGQDLYSSFAIPGGKAWLGSSDGYIYYTDDYAQSWRKLNSPFDEKNFMEQICMRTATQGAAAGLHDSIYLTTDNWQTATAIPTPADLHIGKNRHSYPSIRSLSYVGPLLIVRQNYQYFYTYTSKIEWHTFPVELSYIAIDEKQQTLYGISDDGKILKFNDNATFSPITDQTVPGNVSAFQADNGQVLVLSWDNCGQYHLLQGSEHAITCTPVYAADKPIDKPYIVDPDSGQVRWGGDCCLYRSDDKGASWRRVYHLPFTLTSVTIKGENELLLSDGEHSYIYTISDPAIRLYQPQCFLNAFLKSPITHATINTGSKGCFHWSNNFLYYKSTGASKLVMTGIDSCYSESRYVPDPRSVPKISLSALKAALQDINHNPYYISQKKDFRVRTKDIDSVRKQLLNNDNDLEKVQTEHLFKLDFESMLKDTTRFTAGFYRSNAWCTTSNWIDVTLNNAAGDSLTLYHKYYAHSPSAWCLPWVISYKGVQFSVYQPGISHVINDMLPPNAMEKKLFSNTNLLLQMGIKKTAEEYGDEE